MNKIAQFVPPSNQAGVEDNEVNLAEYVDVIYDNRWIIAAITAVCLLAGAAYAFFAQPIFEANLMVQVEDSEKSAGSFLGDAASSLFDVKTPSAGEIEIIRSRMILGAAVENTKLYIDAHPRYIPIIGRWMARRAEGLSDPRFLGMPGFVSGKERIVVAQFDVPPSLEAAKFDLTAGENGSFTLTQADLDKPIAGEVGKALKINMPSFGNIYLLVGVLEAKPGAVFRLTRFSKQLTLNRLQDDLKIVEKGKQSGVIDVSWQSGDGEKLTSVLNEIGRLYVRQNIERKAAEAQKTLGFLDSQLPEFKKLLEKSEDTYNKFRNEKGTVSLDDEAKIALTQVVDLQAKLLDAQQKRRDLISRFTAKHPEVQTIDAQISALNADISNVNGNIRKMPLLQQDTVRMQRDIKVNTDLYVSLLNSSLQMNLAKEGKVGNVRLLDEAVIPEQAVKPKKPLAIAIALFAGLFLGVVAAIARSIFFGGIKNPNEIEIHTGLNVYSTIPLSDAQAGFDRSIRAKASGVHLLVAAHPEDPAVESLRSLRTALQFAMLEAKNNVILISGATPGVGKSFVSVNFAAIVAATGKRVLLIDADLRKGYINQVFSIARANGLSEVIVGSKAFDQVVHTDVLVNLSVLTTGLLPPNPAELLLSESFKQLLEHVAPIYDLIVIDTAPILVAADTSAVAPHAGTLLLVARAEKSYLGELTESVKQLAHVGCSVNGVILNAMDMTKRHYGSYGYKYGGYRYTQYKYKDPAG